MNEAVQVLYWYALLAGQRVHVRAAGGPRARDECERFFSIFFQKTHSLLTREAIVV